MIILWSFPGWTRVVQIVKNINDSTDNMVKISETTDKTLTYVTKVIGMSTGTAKGTVDFVDAVVCQDGVCDIVRGVGVCADGISMAASFIPGPNVTTVVTVPISVGCKVFVYCYKKAKKMPWGC
nr:hypothetical protein [Cylindrotheca closterium]